MSKDVFRKTYRDLTKEEISLMNDIKDKAQELHELLDFIPNREGALAKTNLEQCIMWAVKGIT